MLLMIRLELDKNLKRLQRSVQTWGPKACTASPLIKNPNKPPIDKQEPQKLCKCVASSGLSRLFMATIASIVTSAIAVAVEAPTNIVSAAATCNFPPRTSTRYVDTVTRPILPQTRLLNLCYELEEACSHHVAKLNNTPLIISTVNYMTEFSVACSEYELYQSQLFIDFWSYYDVSIVIIFAYELSTYSLKHIRSSIVLLFILEKKTT